ncbi:uncharacterized protein BJ212DRAFT_1305067 [Suillus subaureus]|uniref:Uncharacterized protein n=1 Tax=Suillus subaureus TaxID=48587 RepID=A0A9P7DRB5_9AGAM|nr:uncharacterized protein BJ212DRAFT_1305067 [Suillus subaureus]KAG1801250.1 hypothetical protein BJ212DRAFT_1305067 [Suillus subaureus]
MTVHLLTRWILFYSDGKKAMAAADNGPSGSDKGQIYSVIAKLVFMDHINLRGKYKKIKVTFGSMGTGVMLAEGTPAKNLLDAALQELPWYMELDAIWHSNPSMAAKVHSSRPGTDHAGAFYSLVQLHGGAGPSMYYGPSQHSSHTPDVSDSPSAYQHGPYLPQNENVFAGDNDDDIADHYGPLHSPLGDALDHIDDDNDMMLGSPSPVTGKKHQLPSSPSPPPSPPKPFIMPLRTPASTYNNHSVFGIQKPSSCGGSKKKKAKSDVSQQVEQVRDEIKSLHSSVMSHHKGRHQHHIAKLKAKSEHNHDVKKYDWLCTTREHEVSQAMVSHQRLQEAKDAEIQLCETDIWVHQAHSLVLNKEAETLCLKIQFHQMMQASKAASDGGTG